jgi:hypothetical protein
LVLAGRTAVVVWKVYGFAFEKKNYVLVFFRFIGMYAAGMG